MGGNVLRLYWPGKITAASSVVCSSSMWKGTFSSSIGQGTVCTWWARSRWEAEICAGASGVRGGSKVWNMHTWKKRHNVVEKRLVERLWRSNLANREVKEKCLYLLHELSVRVNVGPCYVGKLMLYSLLWCSWGVSISWLGLPCWDKHVLNEEELQQGRSKAGPRSKLQENFLGVSKLHGVLHSLKTKEKRRIVDGRMGKEGLFCSLPVV